MNKFNENHPEKRENETFITNASVDGFKKNIFKTKRLGSVAYTMHGDNMNSKILFPLFAKTEEVQRVMLEQNCSNVKEINFYKKS